MSSRDLSSGSNLLFHAKLLWNWGEKWALYWKKMKSCPSQERAWNPFHVCCIFRVKLSMLLCWNLWAVPWIPCQDTAKFSLSSSLTFLAPTLMIEGCCLKHESKGYGECFICWFSWKFARLLCSATFKPATMMWRPFMLDEFFEQILKIMRVLKIIIRKLRAHKTKPIQRHTTTDLRPWVRASNPCKKASYMVKKVTQSCQDWSEFGY